VLTVRRQGLRRTCRSYSRRELVCGHWLVRLHITRHSGTTLRYFGDSAKF
jgi:hypothetical protein